MAQRTPPSTPEFITRLAVTLGTLAIYRLGTHLPLAGIDQAQFANLMAGIDQGALANVFQGSGRQHGSADSSWRR